MEEKVKQIVEKYDKSIEVSLDDHGFINLTKVDWEGGDCISFEIDQDDETIVLEEIETFFKLKYISGRGCIGEDYIEILVDIPNSDYTSAFNGNNLTLEQIGQHKIIYEVGGISDNLERLININHSYDYFEPGNALNSIKVYNVQSIINKNYLDPEFELLALELVKCVMFELSYKYSIPLTLQQLPESEYDFEDPVEVTKEKLERIKIPFLEAKYDKDLVDYYIRALRMELNEFKYLAYYQVLECIFDEVYLYENVQDLKQIINSSRFSSFDDGNIIKIIRVVDQYNKNKTDREKLKLVLEKYFKGNIHDEAFYLVNSDIVELVEKMGILKKEELKDLQKVATVLYDYRCNCTHSNRMFPFRVSFDSDSIELENYINFIKKVAERVIINYKAVPFG